jgi:hypothetical protein
VVELRAFVGLPLAYTAANRVVLFNIQVGGCEARVHRHLGQSELGYRLLKLPLDL